MQAVRILHLSFIFIHRLLKLLLNINLINDTDATDILQS